MTKRSRFFLLLACMAASFSFASAQNDIPLTVTKITPEKFTFSEVQNGVYEVTTGPDNAFFQFDPIQTEIPEGVGVLSFEYFCASGMEFMVVTVNNELVRIEENMIRMPIAEGWSTFSVDVSDKLALLDEPGDFLSLAVFANTAKPTTMRLQNPRLRAYTEKELEQKLTETARREREERMNYDIDVYLKKNHPCEVSLVDVTDDAVEVSGDIKGMQGDVILCEVPLFGDVTEKDFITQEKINGRTTFKKKFDRFTTIDGEQYDRLYSRWVLVQRSQTGFLICSHARYADQVEADRNMTREVVRNKKGIGGISANGYESDVDDLQATSSTMNVNLTFVGLQPGEDKIPHEYNGKTYYMDANAIAKFDKTLQYLASKDVIVSAIILIPPAGAFPDKEAGALFEHPDFNPAGIYSMPNMTSLAAVNLYAAAIDFLASRYMRPDNMYGRIHHWIAHNEVDAGWVWTNVGVKTALRFMDIYVKSLRLLYYTGRKYDANSEVLITLTHYWQDRHNEYCYPSAQLLELLLDYTEAEGDFRWGVAHHPYPQSLFEPKAWLDTDATFDYNTKLITFKNLEVLDAWIKHPRTLYKGTEKRTLFLSEQNPNSKDYSEEALREQAAGMAYALKKLEACDGIDAYQMHGWFDQRGEGGLRIGVRRFPDDEVDPAGRKPAWFVFQAFDTDREAEVFEFAKPIIGITDWSEIIYKDPIAIPLDRKCCEAGCTCGDCAQCCAQECCAAEQCCQESCCKK